MLEIIKNNRCFLYISKNENGNFHSYNDKPAFVSHNYLNNELSIIFCNNGIESRENGYSYLNVAKNDNREYIYHYRYKNNGKYNRIGEIFLLKEQHYTDDDAAFRILTNKEIRYYKNNLVYRKDEMSFWNREIDNKMIQLFDSNEILYKQIEYSNNSPQIDFSYYKNGVYHRDNGPAFIEYTKNKDDKRYIKTAYNYYKYGILHNENGPASYLKRKGKERFEYYIYGKKYDKIDYFLELAKLAVK